MILGSNSLIKHKSWDEVPISHQVIVFILYGKKWNVFVFWIHMDSDQINISMSQFQGIQRTFNFKKKCIFQFFDVFVFGGPKIKSSGDIDISQKAAVLLGPQFLYHFVCLLWKKLKNHMRSFYSPQATPMSV